jgi:AcrR family transcriptional regulator
LTDRSINSIMPRTAEQYQEIREEKKQLIMDTALELFAKEGFHKTSISTIARNAGIAKGLLYNYFKSKEELVIELMKAGFFDLMSSFDPNHDNVLTREELKSFIINVMKNIAEKHRFWKLYFAVISQPIVNEVAFGEIMKTAMPFFRILTNFFATAGVKNPEAETRFFTAMMDGIAMNFAVDPGHFPLDIALNRVLEIYQLHDVEIQSGTTNDQ